MVEERRKRRGRSWCWSLCALLCISLRSPSRLELSLLAQGHAKRRIPTGHGGDAIRTVAGGRQPVARGSDFLRHDAQGIVTVNATRDGSESTDNLLKDVHRREDCAGARVEQLHVDILRPEGFPAG